MSDEDRLMDHQYDGIQEFDNPLPGWWRATFWATIVFAFGYVAWFHTTGHGSTPDQRYREQLAEYNGKREQRDLAEAASVNEQLLARDASDPKVVEKGAGVFRTRCVSCHTEDGHGLIGPNLTDHYQLHGESRMDIFKTIRAGVAGTPMLAWGEQLPPTEVVAVAAFVTTLRGKDIPGKPPQGHPVPAFDK